MTIDEFFAIRFKNSVNYNQRQQSGYNWGDGAYSEIGKERFRTVLIRKGVPLTIIDILFGKIDTDNDGKISRLDFLKVMQQYAPQVHEQMSEPAENAFHTNNQPPEASAQAPTLSLDELKKIQQKKVFTYNRNGVQRFSAAGVTVNARW